MSRISKKQSDKQAERLAGKKANDLALRMKLHGPIADLSMLQKSVLFAEVSMISYLSIEECNTAAGKLGFTDGKFFNCDGSQAYWFVTEFDSVVVCRGTEPNEWNDIKADANAWTALAETVGKVHRGFKREVDDLWPYLETALQENKKPLWFAGHSLGGAMAKICASRCLLSHIKSEPEELYTYGSPRVGNKTYVNHVKIPHYRWVNNNDIVTRVPPVWLSYKHSGNEMYINRLGQLKVLKGWQKASDRLQGFIKGLSQFRLDQLTDHSIVDYIEAIYSIQRRQEPDVIRPNATTKTAVPPAHMTSKTEAAGQSTNKPADATSTR